MDYMTVSEVSKSYNISTRMLRYYENAGMIKSERKADYAYRIYDENAVRRLQQIIILRKLRIPLKQIAVILNDEIGTKALEIMRENLSELDDEMKALGIIKSILSAYISRLDESIHKKIRLDLLEDSELIDIAKTLSLSKLNLKEDLSMDSLNEAQKITEKKIDIRIIYIPPAIVAASHYFGPEPENNAGRQLTNFIKDSGLAETKKDFRVYGFNNPTPQSENETYGYEFWATIPNNMEVPEPLVKKEFAGGLYAAHCINMGDFHEWGPFYEHVKNSKEYEIEHREPLGMGGTLEEHLNPYYYYTGKQSEIKQLDLLIPIKLSDNI